MSLRLEHDTPKPVIVKTYGPTEVYLIADKGDITIGISDFCEAIKYVLINTDLVRDSHGGLVDLRLDLVQTIKNMRVVEGFAPGEKRLEFSQESA